MTPSAWLDSLQNSGIRPGLTRMRALLRALGNPQHAAPSIIVSGTNGKGSTSAMLASILNEAGYRTGLYTSPHLVDIRERWMIGQEGGRPVRPSAEGRTGRPPSFAMIDPVLLDESIEAMREAATRVGITPTYFEALTLIAFIAFARAECERVVLEVGMGGRLDATNVVRPIAALITPIGFDHMEFLGNTLRAIASEKAGVIHRGTLVLTTNDDPIALAVIRRRAEKFGNRFIHVTEEHDTPLAGAFQRRNAALAVRAARELGIADDAIERGVRNTRWRGRLEHLRVAGKDIWIDGGHNVHAAACIAPFFDENVPRPRLLVFGIMSDKDVQPVSRLLFPLFDRVITTEPYPPRSVRASDLGGIAIPDPEDALRAAMDAPECAIVVTGSLYLAGAAIAFFDKIARP
ncbi:MAG TPA: folylpolyglutamate synthase/dihydrofolate synthase family protein [Thermoanaerobaculia bacterium]|nr:folylpolyglutamate synthase/dihydrofolate synthase family protein [Thermoanaerobaculia bacterium]